MFKYFSSLKVILLKIKANLSRFQIFFSLFNVGNKNKKIVYVVENTNWSTRRDGENITKELNFLGRNSVVDFRSSLHRNAVIHFGSSGVFNLLFNKRKKTNKYVVTFFHGDPDGNNPNHLRSFQKLRENISRIDAVVYSTSIMHKRFIQQGIPKEKLHYIPIGYDPSKFFSIKPHERNVKRKAFNIPEDSLVIGSFQKDDVGWEGDTPKYEKGPDIFIEVIKKINQVSRVFVVLSGPSRGYVKKRLEEESIDYVHNYYEEPDKVADLYRILDLYLITSREEGGPKAVVESMASGIPLVSTKVGMANDIIEKSDCGIVCQIDDIASLASASLKIHQDHDLKKRFSINGIKNSKPYTWSRIAESCDELYSEILKLKV